MQKKIDDAKKNLIDAKKIDDAKKLIHKNEKDKIQGFIIVVNKLNLVHYYLYSVHGTKSLSDKLYIIV